MIAEATPQQRDREAYAPPEPNRTVTEGLKTMPNAMKRREAEPLALEHATHDEQSSIAELRDAVAGQRAGPHDGSEPAGMLQPDATRPLEEPVPLTQTQLVTAVADRAELTKNDAKRALTALEDILLEEIGNAQKVKIGGLVQLTVRVKPATKARKGRNPATGEEITIAAKPASVDLRARPLTKAKNSLPSVQKARRRLAG